MKGFDKFLTDFKKGDTIYKQGDMQPNFYIINSGKVNIKDDESNIILTSLSKGDFFGEESLVMEQTSSYSVEVIEDSKIIKIPFLSLVDMMKKSSDISMKILKKLSEKNLKIINNIMTLKLRDSTISNEKSVPELNENDDLTSEKLDDNLKAYLVIQRSNRIVKLTKKSTNIGRRDYTTGFVPDVDLTKEDEEKYISRKHASIIYSDNKFYIFEEPGAVNGTFLNGNKLDTGVKYDLANEDEITLCHLNIVFKY